MRSSKRPGPSSSIREFRFGDIARAGRRHRCDRLSPGDGSAASRHADRHGSWRDALLKPEPQLHDLICRARRSEEHTSELQSLMRISYAVFCLKKKIITAVYTIYCLRSII